jgi:predicted transcriptional regulator
MDPFDDSILNLFRDGKPREFQQILTEIRLSHNTLRLHLDKLAERGLINKSKQPSKGPGRPKIVYSTPISALKPSAAPLNPSTGVITLTFSKLSQVCRFEKGGFCKKVRGSCNARYCPQIV